MKLRDVFIALITVLILGTSFVAVKLGVREIPPLLLTSLRFFFAAVPAIFFIKRPEVPIRFMVSFGLTMGAVQFALLYTAIKLGMPAGLSSVILQMQVFFTVLLAYICFGEKPLPLEIAGGLVALVGVALIGVENGAVELVPFALVSASALAWASGICRRFGGGCAGNGRTSSSEYGSGWCGRVSGLRDNARRSRVLDQAAEPLSCGGGCAVWPAGAGFRDSQHTPAAWRADHPHRNHRQRLGTGRFDSQRFGGPFGGF